MTSLDVTLAVNARFRTGPQTGVQRVAAEILAKLDLPHREVAPKRPAMGLKGHAWEQFMLPLKMSGAPLWSPCNTGPIATKSQVVTIHDAAVFDHPEWFSRQFVTVYRLLLPQLARTVRRIVTVSDFSRTRLAAALDIPIGRIDVVANGVSERFVPAPEDMVAAATARYNVRPGRYFVSLATLEPRKNLAVTRKAWAAAYPSLPADMRLLLVGGTGKAQIFRRSDNAEDADPDTGIIRAGFVADEDLPPLLTGAAALLYPSRYEGFGLPILEAMACGAPVVTANSSSLPEVAGAAALYVEPDDWSALSDQIQRLSRDPALQSDLRDAGFDRARSFSWAAAAAQMRHIFERDLGVR